MLFTTEEIQKKIKNAYEKIENTTSRIKGNPVLDNAAKTAISLIPTVGPVLLQWYERVDNHDITKTRDIQVMLKSLQSQNEKQFQSSIEYFKVNQNEIIRNRELMKDFSKQIFGKIDLMNNKVEQIYQELKEFRAKVEKNNVLIDHDSNTFIGFGFKISWPENWRKSTEKEISKGLDNLESFQSTLDLPDMRPPIVLQIISRKEYSGFHPNVFVTVEKDSTKEISSIFNQTMFESLKEEGLEIRRHDIDIHFNSATLETTEAPFVDNFQIQKWIIRKNKLYTITITELQFEVMKNEPELFKEIKSIARSFTFTE